MELKTYVCPNCGAPVQEEMNTQAFICKFCSSIIAVTPRTANQIETDHTDLPILRKVEPELKFQANHQVSALNAQGGHLWITMNEVIFKPHSLNVGSLGKRYIRIQDVVGYKKGPLTKMTIITKSGYEMKLAVWKKDEIINEIEKRRINYFQSQGLPIPPLQYGDRITSSGNASCNDAVPAEQMSSNSGCMGAIIALVTISLTLYSIFAL